MVPTYLLPGQDEKDSINKADSCLANIHLYILDIGLRPELDDIPDVDDPQSRKEILEI